MISLSLPTDTLDYTNLNTEDTFPSTVNLTLEQRPVGGFTLLFGGDGNLQPYEFKNIYSGETLTEEWIWVKDIENGVCEDLCTNVDETMNCTTGLCEKLPSVAYIHVEVANDWFEIWGTRCNNGEFWVNLGYALSSGGIVYRAKEKTTGAGVDYSPPGGNDGHLVSQITSWSNYDSRCTVAIPDSYFYWPLRYPGGTASALNVAELFVLAKPIFKRLLAEEGYSLPD